MVEDDKGEPDDDDDDDVEDDAGSLLTSSSLFRFFSIFFAFFLEALVVLTWVVLFEFVCVLAICLPSLEVVVGKVEPLTVAVVVVLYSSIIEQVCPLPQSNASFKSFSNPGPNPCPNPFSIPWEGYMYESGRRTGG